MNTKPLLLTAAISLFTASGLYFDDATAQVAPPSIISGGVSASGMTAIDQAQNNYRLKLVYTEPNGDYLANVKVAVRNHAGQTVAKTESSGPVVLMNLTPGTYTVTSSLDGAVKTEKVRVRSNRLDTYYIKLPTV